MQGGTAELPRCPQAPEHMLQLVPPSCLAALPPQLWAGLSCGARGQLWALGTVAGTELLPPAPAGTRKTPLTEDSALPSPVCPVLARAASGQSWQQLGPGICTLGSWHCCMGPTSPAQPPHSVWIPAEIQHLCVLPGAWRHLSHHKTPAWRGFTPLSLPCARGALRHGQGRGGMAAVKKQLVGAAGGAEIGENPGQAFPFLGAAGPGWQGTGLGTRSAAELEVSAANGAVPSHGPAASTVLAVHKTCWGVSNSRG